jgi:hypothetical protein
MNGFASRWSSPSSPGSGSSAWLAVVENGPWTACCVHHHHALKPLVNSPWSPRRTARWLNIAVNALLVLCGAGGDRGPGWRACAGGQKLSPSVTSSVSHSAQALDDFQAPWIIMLGPSRVASSLCPSSISWHVWGWGSSGRCACVCVCLYCLWSASDRLSAYM